MRNISIIKLFLGIAIIGFSLISGGCQLSSLPESEIITPDAPPMDSGNVTRTVMTYLSKRFRGRQEPFGD